MCGSAEQISMRPPGTGIPWSHEPAADRHPDDRDQRHGLRRRERWAWIAMLISPSTESICDLSLGTPRGSGIRHRSSRPARGLRCSRHPATWRPSPRNHVPEPSRTVPPPVRSGGMTTCTWLADATVRQTEDLVAVPAGGRVIETGLIRVQIGFRRAPTGRLHRRRGRPRAAPSRQGGAPPMAPGRVRTRRAIRCCRRPPGLAPMSGAGSPRCPIDAQG